MIHSQYSAIHLTPSSEVHPAQAEIFEEEGFAPIRRTAAESGINLNTIYRATDDVQNEIVRTANRGDYDLLLLGSARSVFSDSYLGGKIRKMLNDCSCNMGIFVDKQFQSSGKVMMLIPGTANPFTLRLINIFLEGKTTNTLTLVNSKDTGLPPELPLEVTRNSSSVLELKPFSALVNESHPLVSSYDLLITTVEDWKTLFNNKRFNLAHLPSVLILKIRN
jgi:hypothetical protein